MERECHAADHELGGGVGDERAASDARRGRRPTRRAPCRR
jgi:hypothetical protein